jgi:hypothetical protein
MPSKRARRSSTVDSRLCTVLGLVAGTGDQTPVIIDYSDTITRAKRFTLTLTEPQRKSLMEFANLPTRLCKKLGAAGVGKQRISVTRRELDELNDQIGVTARDIAAAHRKRLHAVQSQVADLLAKDLGDRL